MMKIYPFPTSYASFFDSVSSTIRSQEHVILLITTVALASLIVYASRPCLKKYQWKNLNPENKDQGEKVPVVDKIEIKIIEKKKMEPIRHSLPPIAVDKPSIAVTNSPEKNFSNIEKSVQFPDKKIILAKLQEISDLAEDERGDIADYFSNETLPQSGLKRVFAKISTDIGKPEDYGTVLENKLSALYLKSPGLESGEPKKIYLVPDAVMAVKSTVEEFKKSHSEKESKTSLKSESLPIPSAAQVEAQHLIKELDVSLKLLLSKSNVPKEDRSLYSFEIEEVTLSANGQCCNLKTNNIVMGYSLYLLLKTYEITTDKYDYTKYGSDSSQTFPLTVEHLKTLTAHFKTLNPLIEESTALFNSLLGREGCVEIGQKRVSEFITDNINLTTSTLNKIAELCDKAKAKGKEAPYSLFFSMLGINLKSHPAKAFYKNLFLTWFSEWEMVGANGKPKQFQTDDPDRSNVNFVQMTQLLRAMTDFIDLCQEMKVKINSNEDYLKHLKTHLEKKLNELASKAGISLGYTYSLDNAHSIEEAKKAYQEIYKKTIDTGINGVFCLKENDLRMEPWPELVQTTYCESPFLRYLNPSTYQNSQGQKLPNLLGLLDKLGTKFPKFQSQIYAFKIETRAFLDSYPKLNLEDISENKKYDRTIALLEKWLVSLLNQDKFSISDRTVDTSLLGLNVISSKENQLEAMKDRVRSLLIPLEKWGFEEYLDDFKWECHLKAAKSMHASKSDQDQMAAFYNLRKAIGTFNGWTRDLEKLASGFMNLYLPGEIAVKVHVFFREVFWELNEQGNDEKLFQLLKYLGFESNQTNERAQREAIYNKYRNNKEGILQGFWHYARFERDLPIYIVSFLIREKYLYKRSGSGRVYSPTLDIHKPTHSCGGSDIKPDSTPTLETKKAGGKETKKKADDTQGTGG